MERKHIRQAALTIVDEEGAEALTMRHLAQHLNSSTSTLYRHYANRSELIIDLIDGVFRESEPPEITQPTWDHILKAGAIAGFEALSRHRRLAPLLIEYPPTGPAAMSRREMTVALLTTNGFSPQVAIQVYATIARYVLGFAMQLNSGEDEDGHSTQLAIALQRLDAAEYPATTQTARIAPMPLEDEFAFGLNLLISGLRRLQTQQETQ